MCSMVNKNAEMKMDCRLSVILFNPLSRVDSTGKKDIPQNSWDPNARFPATQRSHARQSVGFLRSAHKGACTVRA